MCIYINLSAYHFFRYLLDHVPYLCFRNPTGQHHGDKPFQFRNGCRRPFLPAVRCQIYVSTSNGPNRLCHLFRHHTFLCQIKPVLLNHNPQLRQFRVLGNSGCVKIILTPRFRPSLHKIRDSSGLICPVARNASFSLIASMMS